MMITSILSEREKEVLHLAMDGLSCKESARILGIKFRTIESHRQHILTKTDSKNLLHLVGKIYRETIITKYSVEENECTSNIQ